MAALEIATLANQIRDVMARSDDPKVITAEVAELAKPYAADMSWVEPRCHETDEGQGIGITVFHEDPDPGLLIETVSWLPGRGVQPHDHQTWGVVIGLEGRECNVTWRRRDQGASPGYAELEKAAEVDVTNGDIVCLMPDDIHSVRNDGQELSMSLHIYGRGLAYTGRSEFDPIANIQRPCPVRRRND